MAKAMALPNQQMLILTEIITAVVTVIWVFSFTADLFIPEYNADQINNIFMVVVGAGLVSFVFHNRSGGDKEDKQ